MLQRSDSNSSPYYTLDEVRVSEESEVYDTHLADAMVSRLISVECGELEISALWNVVGISKLKLSHQTNEIISPTFRDNPAVTSQSPSEVNYRSRSALFFQSSPRQLCSFHLMSYFAKCWILRVKFLSVSTPVVFLYELSRGYISPSAMLD